MGALSCDCTKIAENSLILDKDNLELELLLYISKRIILSSSCTLLNYESPNPRIVPQGKGRAFTISIASYQLYLGQQADDQINTTFWKSDGLEVAVAAKPRTGKTETVLKTSFSNFAFPNLRDNPLERCMLCSGQKAATLGLHSKCSPLGRFQWPLEWHRLHRPTVGELGLFHAHLPAPWPNGIATAELHIHPYPARRTVLKLLISKRKQTWTKLHTSSRSLDVYYSASHPKGDPKTSSALEMGCSACWTQVQVLEMVQMQSLFFWLPGAGKLTPFKPAIQLWHAVTHQFQYWHPVGRCPAGITHEMQSNCNPNGLLTQSKGENPL